MLGAVFIDSDFVYRPDNAGRCVGCSVFKKCSKAWLDDGFGMPSGHSITMIMAATFWSLWIWNNGTASRANKITRISLLCLMALLVVASRTPLVEGCHSYLQVLVGSILGGLLGVGFYYLESKKLAVL